MNFKKISLVIGLTCGLFLDSPVQAENDCTNKIYVSQKQIHLTKDLIEIDLSQGTFATDVIFKDTNGYYVLSFRLVKSKFWENEESRTCPHYGWIAPSRRMLKSRIEENH